MAALVAMLLASGVIMAFAAFGVDTGRWYVEIQRVQKAADAAALAGVPYLPQDMTNAIKKAKEVAARNGYDDASGNVVVTVEMGTLASQLRVTIESRILNSMGGAIGVRDATIIQSAVADFQAPAPMGSPCNTFGNEPRAGSGAGSPSPSTASATGTSPLTNCKRDPDFWAGIQGMRSSKSNGDRYMNSYCGIGSEFKCTGKGTFNSEFKPIGYFWVVKVQPAAVNKPIDLQLYDPAYVNSGSFDCQSLPKSTDLSNDMNPYVTTDGKTRYSKDLSTSSSPSPFCNGDTVPDAAEASDTTAPTTTYVLRAQTDSQDPTQAPVISSCVRQYLGVNTVPTVKQLKEGAAGYNKHLAQIFHNWTSLCTFTPTRSGDYYLQVRTNVAAAGSPESSVGSGATPLIFEGSSTAWAPGGNVTTGRGNNTFAIRAVTPTGSEKSVSVSGFDRMPIFANAETASSEFNLIRVLPGSRGQFISFAFYDAADSAADSARITVLPPSDATGSIKTTPFPNSCKSFYADNRAVMTTLSSCSAAVSGAANNTKLQTIDIPIPTDYNCVVTDMAACWYRVKVDYGSGAVRDFTTWDAIITGDPVRLIE